MEKKFYELALLIAAFHFIIGLLANYFKIRYELGMDLQSIYSLELFICFIVQFFVFEVYNNDELLALTQGERTEIMGRFLRRIIAVLYLTQAGLIFWYLHLEDPLIFTNRQQFVTDVLRYAAYAVYLEFRSLVTAWVFIIYYSITRYMENFISTVKGEGRGTGRTFFSGPFIKILLLHIVLLLGIAVFYYMGAIEVLELDHMVYYEQFAAGVLPLFMLQNYAYENGDLRFMPTERFAWAERSHRRIILVFFVLMGLSVALLDYLQYVWAFNSSFALLLFIPFMPLWGIFLLVFNTREFWSFFMLFMLSYMFLLSLVEIVTKIRGEPPESYKGYWEEDEDTPNGDAEGILNKSGADISPQE